jgi:hypothetical protein
LTPSQSDDDGAMVPKYPLEGGEGDKAGEAIDVEQAFDFCHADIVTEFRSIAIIIPPGFFRGIRALKGESYPLKFTKSQISIRGPDFQLAIYLTLKAPQ